MSNLNISWINIFLFSINYTISYKLPLANISHIVFYSTIVFFSFDSIFWFIYATDNIWSSFITYDQCIEYVPYSAKQKLND